MGFFVNLINGSTYWIPILVSSTGHVWWNYQWRHVVPYQSLQWFRHSRRFIAWSRFYSQWRVWWKYGEWRWRGAYFWTIHEQKGDCLGHVPLKRNVHVRTHICVICVAVCQLAKLWSTAVFHVIQEILRLMCQTAAPTQMIARLAWPWNW